MDLIKLCQRLWNSGYDPKPFPGLIWQHRPIGGNCIVFVNGVINCNGKAASFRGSSEITKVCQKASKPRMSSGLQRCQDHNGFSQSHLSAGLDLNSLAKDRSLLYEPELFPALNFIIFAVFIFLFIPVKWSSRV